jgi:hypothetical protein
MGSSGQALAAVRAIIAALLALAPLAAQDPPGDRPPKPVEERRFVLVDRVVATVGDTAILQSKVMQTAAGDIRNREQQNGGRLNRNTMDFLFGMALERLIQQYQLAQAVKTLGILPPSRVEEIIQAEVQDAEKEQVRLLGSHQKLSEELVRQGRTWQSFERDTRLEKSSELTEQMTVQSRLQNQRNLFISPKMLRDFYNANQKDYVFGPHASLAVVQFVGDAAGKAPAAAKEWRDLDKTADEMAKQYGARAPKLLALEHINEASVSGLKTFMVRFALDHPQGTVSDPIVDEGTTWVLKVIERIDGRNGQFDDPEVQANLRHRLEDEVYHILKMQAVLRAGDRTYVQKYVDLPH